MKIIRTITLAALVVASCGVASAQRYTYRQSPADTTFTLSSRHETIVYQGSEAFRKAKQNRKDLRWKWHEGNFMGVMLNYNGLTGTASGKGGQFMELTGKSIGVDINFIDMVLYSYRNFGIVTGLGIESNNYRFRNNVSLKVDENDVTVADHQYTDAGIFLSKSKLTTTYLNIPLLLQFKLGKIHSSWTDSWVSFGVVAGLRLESYTKVMSEQTGTVRNFGDFNLRNVHYGVMVGAGLGWFSVWGKYYPHSMFRTDQGPHVEQFSFGIGLSL